MRPVLDALAATGLFTADNIERALIEPACGLTNRSYRLTIGSDQYMLRLPGPGTESYVDREQEAHNARAAAHLGIAPEVMYCDPRAGTQLVRYINDARALDAQSLRDPATLELTVELLARLHRSGSAFRGEMALFPKLDQYFQLAEARMPDALRELDALRRRAQALRPRLEARREPLCPCHIDPTPPNFLMVAGPEPQLYLLDWEYSARCEPVWDLADLAAEAEFTEEQDARLLSYYYGRVSAERADRFVLYKALLHLLAAAWGATQLALGRDDTRFERLFVARAAQASRLLASIPSRSDSR